MLTIGRTIPGNKPVTLDAEAVKRHLAVFGKTGTGKSTLLRTLFAGMVTTGHGATVIDPHNGALIRQLVEDIPDDRLDDVVLLDLTDPDYSFGINFFALEREPTLKAKAEHINQVTTLFKKVGGTQAAPLIETWLPVFTHTFMDAGEGTFTDIPRLLSDPAYRNRLTRHLENGFARFYWETHTVKDRVPQAEIDSTIRRLGKFLSNPLLEQVVGQEKTTVPFREIMERDMILLVVLPDTDKLTTELIGTVIFQRLYNASAGRKSRSPYLIIADEAQLVATPDMADMIDEIRKRGVGVALATQRPGKMDDDDIEEAMMNVGTLVVMTVDYKDAVALGRRFPGMDEPVPQYTYADLPTQMIMHVGHPKPQVVEIVKRLTDSQRITLDNHYLRMENGAFVAPLETRQLPRELREPVIQLRTWLTVYPVRYQSGVAKPTPASDVLQALNVNHGDGAAMAIVRGRESLMRVLELPVRINTGKYEAIREASRRRYDRLRTEVAQELAARSATGPTVYFDDPEPPLPKPSQWPT